MAYSLANKGGLLAQKMGRPRDALPLAEEAYKMATDCGLTSLAQQIKPFLDYIGKEIISDRNQENLTIKTAPPHVSGGVVDQIHFSVTSPPVILAGNSHIVDIWAYLECQRKEVMKRAREETIGRKIIVKSKGPVKVERGTVVTVNLQISGLEVVPQEDTILWEGEIGNAQFKVTVPSGFPLGKCLGTAIFFVNGLPITKLFFELQIGSLLTQPVNIPAREKRYNTVFASYASKDLNEVLGRIQGLRKAIPDLDIFLDVANLRSGENWRKRLQDEIQQRDTLFLFWSQAASISEYVNWEWRRALETHGIDFIDPVPLVSPEEVPPPKELADKLHFNDWMLAYRRRG